MGVSHLLEHMVFKGTRRRSPASSRWCWSGWADRWTPTPRASTRATRRVCSTRTSMSPSTCSPTSCSAGAAARGPRAGARGRARGDRHRRGHARRPRFDLHASLMWGGHPYGYSILGTRETVAALTVGRPAPRAHAERYLPATSWFAAAGNVEHDRFVERWPAEFGRAPAARQRSVRPAGRSAPPGSVVVPDQRRAGSRADHIWSGARRRSGRAIRAATRWSCSRPRSAAA
jgi:predicted Zn-dependent peptidase